MLITLCYSVITWIQSKHRQEIHYWLQDYSLRSDHSIIINAKQLDNNTLSTGIDGSASLGPNPRLSLYSTSAISNNRDSEYAYIPSTASSTYPATTLTSRSNSISSSIISSTPRKSYISRDSNTEPFDWLQRCGQVSDLCYNAKAVTWTKLLLEEDRVRIWALSPKQIVDLHEWTTFIGAEGHLQDGRENELDQIYILLEAGPGAIERDQYRNFLQFGRLAAWKCGEELALILHSTSAQVIDLMHIFRLGQVILSGGWKVFRLTTVKCEGNVGTLVRRPDAEGLLQMTVADLHRLSAVVGFVDASLSSTLPILLPHCSVAKSTSKSDFAAISEESSLEESEEDTLKKLPNWHDRSPRKKSVQNSPCERPIPRRRTGSYTGSLAGSGSKSLSLASLLMCSRSQSVDEDNEPIVASSPLSPQSGAVNKGAFGSRQGLIGSVPAQSCDNLWGSRKSLVYGSYTPKILSPAADPVNRIPGLEGKSFKSYSAFSSPKKMPSHMAARSHGGSMFNMGKNTPCRIGKPPNILVLCEDKSRRAEIVKLLKFILAGDRYVIYDIRWDQLAVGGWAEQTALLVLSGRVPDEAHIPILLQFLGDGGRMFSWCCDSPPFGINSSTARRKSILNDDSSAVQKAELLYQSSQTRDLPVSPILWGPVGDVKELPQGFQRIIGTQDSDGYSRPLTASVYARLKTSNEVAILMLDGGALGGKAVLSRVHFEKSNDDTARTLLSNLLSQALGLNLNSASKELEYSFGFLLGDHLRVKSFLDSVPAVLQQQHLKIEIVQRGSTTHSKPSAEVLPIKVLECPANFSTLDYFNNLTTEELGRVVVYSDVLSSTMHVINGRSLQHGLTVIAGRQTCGKGRGGNVWLSPPGSACFSLLVKLSLNSPLGRRIPLIQHLASMSVVLSIEKHKEINMRMKWPNDIYIDNQKIGGNLVQTTIEGNTALVNIGIGVNVTNEYPTVSINSALPSGEQMKIPVLIAKVLSNLETLIQKVEQGGLSEVLAMYTENWMHGSKDGDEHDNVVRVEVSNGNYAECKILGIDEFGFLRVVDINSSHVFSVQPDGNSFDIVNKLIAIKA